MILPEFLRWAADQQVARSNSRYRVSTVLNSPTAKRSAALEIEEFEIEPGGWVTSNLLRAGSLYFWESGEVDVMVQSAEGLRSQMPPEYAEHWDGAQPPRFDEMFATFLSYFPTEPLGERNV